MKIWRLCTLALGAAVATLWQASGVDAWGVCYDPLRQDKPTADSVKKDYEIIKTLGFASIRTYEVLHGDINLAQLALDAGLSVSITIPVERKTGNYDPKQVQAALAAASSTKGGAKVLHINVGNENLDDQGVADNGEVPKKMIDLVTELKSKAPKGVLVGTVQRNTEVLDPKRANIGGIKDLFKACDVVGVNIHPVFDPNSGNAMAGMASFKGQWANFGKSGTASDGLNKDKAIVTEVGWPTEGDTREGLGGKATMANAQTFYREYTKWANENITPDRSFYFQMFDLPYRKGEAGNGKESIEAHFGISGVDGKFKFATFDFKKLNRALRS